MTALRAVVTGLRYGLAAVVLLGLVAGVALTHGNPEPSPVPQGGWVGHSDIEWAMNGNVWSPKIAAEHPGCHKTRPGTLAPSVVVVWESGRSEVMDTDAAFASVGATAYDFWVVGQCDGAVKA